MSPFEHGEVFVLDDGGEVRRLLCGPGVVTGWPVGPQQHSCFTCCTLRVYLAQVDLDLGNYERFLDITLTRDNNLTTGKVYQVATVTTPL